MTEKQPKPLLNKLNTSVELASLLALGIFSGNYLDESLQTPAFLQGRIFDGFLTAQMMVGLRLNGSDNKLKNAVITLALAFGAETAQGIAQGLHIIKNGFDFPGDYIAYTVGVLGILAMEEVAKYIGKKEQPSIL